MKRWLSRLSLGVICALALGSTVMGANSILVESKTVLPNATGVEVGVYITNDVSLTAINLCLEIRTVTGGAYFAGPAIPPAVFEFTTVALADGGRIGTKAENEDVFTDLAPLMDSQTLQYYNTPFGGLPCSGPTSLTWSDGAAFLTPNGSPDAFFWNGLVTVTPSWFEPGSDGSPGNGTPSVLLTFLAMNGNVGTFEIDTMCAEPANHTVFVDTLVGAVQPTFTKGVITLEEANDAPVWDSCHSGIIANTWGDTLEPDETATLFVSATDPEDDSITVTAVDLPPNSTFEQTGDGTGVFSFTPDQSQALEDGTMLFIATDVNGNADTCEVAWFVDAWSAVQSAGGPIPESYALDQNYPNPFNAGTIIPFSVGEYGHVQIAVYNILGGRVTTLVDEELAPGRYTTDWDGTGADGRPLATGIYFYRISANAHVATRKMLLLK